MWLGLGSSVDTKFLCTQDFLDSSVHHGEDGGQPPHPKVV